MLLFARVLTGWWFALWVGFYRDRDGRVSWWFCESQRASFIEAVPFMPASENMPDMRRFDVECDRAIYRRGKPLRYVRRGALVGSCRRVSSSCIPEHRLVSWDLKLSRYSEVDRARQHAVMSIFSRSGEGFQRFPLPPESSILMFFRVHWWLLPTCAGRRRALSSPRAAPLRVILTSPPEASAVLCGLPCVPRPEFGTDRFFFFRPPSPVTVFFYSRQKGSSVNECE